jgi:hypothetical protein
MLLICAMPPVGVTVASLTSSSFTAGQPEGWPAGDVLRGHQIEVFQPFMLGVYTPQGSMFDCSPPAQDIKPGSIERLVKVVGASVQMRDSFRFEDLMP